MVEVSIFCRGDIFLPSSIEFWLHARDLGSLCFFSYISLDVVIVDVE